MREVEPFCLVTAPLITVLLHLPPARGTSTEKLPAFPVLKKICIFVRDSSTG
ncbi:MAG: hypothetical protein ACXADA_10795 [Candidatus Hodarchaeales archaeon]